MSRIFDANIVEAQIAKQTLNGTVIVFSNNGTLAQETIPINMLKRLRGANAIEVFERVVIERAGGVLTTICVEDGFLRAHGWLNRQCELVPIADVQPMVDHGFFGPQPSDKNPTPTLTHWRSAKLSVHGQVLHALFETRGVPVTDETVQRYAPMGLYFNDEQKLIEYVTERKLYVSDVSSKLPFGEFVGYSDLKAA